MKYVITFLLACFFSSTLFATSISNKELLKACKEQSVGPQNFCYGFIISAANAAQFYRNIADVEDEYIGICFPKNIANKEIVDLYIAWVEKNPTVVDSPAFIGVSSSFSTKYSCSKKKEKEEEKK